ncbi:phenylalanine--tRNA ligase subunit alpha [bacterium]|nr:phenylalanine--tRNA ligase subunit alpha [bacterium]
MDLITLKKKIKEISEEAGKEIENIKDNATLDIWKIKYLGRKGVVNSLFSNMSELDIASKKEAGVILNSLKNSLTEQYEYRLSSSDQEKSDINLSFPGKPVSIGHLHPISVTIREMSEIFTRLGFGIVSGPEIETSYYNFEALNIPDGHPSRDAWDTLYLNEADKILLRPHTSPVQIRMMEKKSPPLRIAAVGKCFRRDAVDATHSPVFHQMEGFMVDTNINFSHLKGVLTYFINKMFGDNISVKFTPSYFPFTEPSAELSMSCIVCKGKGCSVCKNSGFIEVLGCGMIHPQVFRNVGYDPEKYTGFAFGMGIERLAIIKFGITDIRYFYQNDMRFITQFI